MQNDWCYIKDSGNFLVKIMNVGNIPENDMLVTADAVELCPNISHNASPKAFRNMLEARENKAVSTDDLVKTTRFVFGKYFEFNGDVNKQISETLISTKSD